MADRYVRLNGTTLSDNRSPSQIDRDRILYSSAFRRLASVTQVVSADESHVFHNRLTHSLQVAQVARRTAELLVKSSPPSREWIDPDVCEAAALAHDSGHPPFGHLAEKTLNALALENGLDDGFEGNAQSFRIMTRLAAHDLGCEGLDLTRATLHALLKYPWLKEDPESVDGKWGAYSSERVELDWACELSPLAPKTKSPEAYIMDWADDVTYSVHDMEDFYKAGLIPLDRLSSSQRERDAFYNETFKRNADRLRFTETELTSTFEDLARLWTDFDPYSGSFLQRQTLKAMASRLIGDYVKSFKIDDQTHRVRIEEARLREVFMLKQLTWHYVIANPALTSHQRGQKLVVQGLFSIYEEAAREKNFNIFPVAYRQKLVALNESADRSGATRSIIDMIASMTEAQAIHLYHRLSGTALGSALIHPVA